MTLTAINGVSLATLTAIGGVSKATLSGINGQTIGGGGSGPSVVQATGNSTASDLTVIKAFAGNVVSGNKLIVAVMTYSQAINATGVTDSQLNSYSQVAHVDANSPGGGSMGIYLATAGSSAADIVTYTGTGGTNYFVMGIFEVSASAAFDAASTGSSGTSTAPDTGNIVTSATDLIIAMACQANTTMTFTEPTGYSLAYEQEDGDNFMAGSVAYKTGVASGTINPVFTLGSSATWGGFGGGFK